MSFASNTQSVRRPNPVTAPLGRHAGVHDEDVAYAFACVTVFGFVAVFACPLLPGLLHLDQLGFDLWSGESFQEIAQAMAASFQNGKAGEFAMLARMSRVMLLAPMVIALRSTAPATGRKSSEEAPRPPGWDRVRRDAARGNAGPEV